MVYGTIWVSHTLLTLLKETSGGGEVRGVGITISARPAARCGQVAWETYQIEEPLKIRLPNAIRGEGVAIVTLNFIFHLSIEEGYSQGEGGGGGGMDRGKGKPLKESSSYQRGTLL